MEPKLARKLANEWNQTFVEFYGKESKYITTADDLGIEVKQTKQGIFTDGDLIHDFAKGHRLNYYFDVDAKGLIFARMF